MCGITAFFARESTIEYKHLDTLFLGAEKRGQDGFGLALIRKDKKTGIRKVRSQFRTSKKYSDPEVTAEVQDILEEMSIGDLVIAIARAAPETEIATNKDDLIRTMQPIVNKEAGLVLVHNGAVSQKIYNDLRKWSEDSICEEREYVFQTDIDSEAIAAAYIAKGRNMKDAMEYLSGGFAAIMYDEDKDMLYVVNDHMQLSHGYIRGLGFFLHSDNDVLGEVIHDYLGATRDGMFIWENFYHHYLDGHAIREIDLQSGFMRKEKYTPRYITPTFDTKNGIVHSLD